jgi:hypothetical protein
MDVAQPARQPGGAPPLSRVDVDRSVLHVLSLPATLLAIALLHISLDPPASWAHARSLPWKIVFAVFQSMALCFSLLTLLLTIFCMSELGVAKTSWPVGSFVVAVYLTGVTAFVGVWVSGREGVELDGAARGGLGCVGGWVGGRPWGTTKRTVLSAAMDYAFQVAYSIPQSIAFTVTIALFGLVGLVFLIRPLSKIQAAFERSWLVRRLARSSSQPTGGSKTD